VWLLSRWLTIRLCLLSVLLLLSILLLLLSILAWSRKRRLSIGPTALHTLHSSAYLLNHCHLAEGSRGSFSLSSCMCLSVSHNDAQGAWQAVRDTGAEQQVRPTRLTLLAMPMVNVDV
jgi:hypothetical protein